MAMVKSFICVLIVFPIIYNIPNFIYKPKNNNNERMNETASITHKESSFFPILKRFGQIVVLGIMGLESSTLSGTKQ
jgi:hypothetical protein